MIRWRRSTIARNLTSLRVAYVSHCPQSTHYWHSITRIDFISVCLYQTFIIVSRKDFFNRQRPKPLRGTLLSSSKINNVPLDSKSLPKQVERCVLKWKLYFTGNLANTSKWIHIRSDQVFKPICQKGVKKCYKDTQLSLHAKLLNFLHT